MARPLSYPFNTLEKVGDSFISAPAKKKYGKPSTHGDVVGSDTHEQAQGKADRYAARHFGGDKIIAWDADGYFLFERVAG